MILPWGRKRRISVQERLLDSRGSDNGMTSWVPYRWNGYAHCASNLLLDDRRPSIGRVPYDMNDMNKN